MNLFNTKTPGHSEFTDYAYNALLPYLDDSEDMAMRLYEVHKKYENPGLFGHYTELHAL